MVKRPKSPETPQDTRIFTVYQPYPLNPNWAFEEDRIKCVRWIAECIQSPDAIWSVLEKPSARGMILVELSKTDFTEHGRFLGEHKWKDILRRPDAEHKKRTTQVFHSFYSTPRDAEKDGWKPFQLDMRQCFKDWIPGKGGIVYPYPETFWCAVPPEDKTGKALCRPLPGAQKPPTRTHVKGPIVGSNEWIAKNTPVTKSAPPTHVHPVDIPPPATSFPPLGSPAPQVKPSGQSQSSRPNKPSEGIKQIHPPQARMKPIAVYRPSTSHPNGGGPRKSAWQIPTPPGAAAAADPTWEETKSSNAWTKKPMIKPDPTPSVVRPLMSASAWDPPVEASAWNVDDDDTFAPLNGQSWASAAATPITGNSPQTSALSLDIYSDDEEDTPLRVAESEVSPPVPIQPRREIKIEEDLWTLDDTPVQKADPDDICEVHGPACTPGICTIMSKKKKEKERLQKARERAEKGREAQKNKKSDKTGQWAKGHRDRSGFGTEKLKSEVDEDKEESTIGKLRAWTADD